MEQYRAGNLQAVKRAGAWFTTAAWLENYKREHPRPGPKSKATR